MRFKENAMKPNRGQPFIISIVDCEFSLCGVICHVAMKGPFIISLLTQIPFKTGYDEVSLSDAVIRGNFQIIRHGPQGFADGTWRLCPGRIELPDSTLSLPWEQVDETTFRELDPTDLLTPISAHTALPENILTIPFSFPGHLLIAQRMIEHIKSRGLD